MSSPKRCSDSHRQEGKAVIWSKKKCVYNSSKRGKEVWGHLLCYCNLFIPLHSSLQQHVNAGYRVETKCGQRNVRETFKLTQIAVFDCLHLLFCCCSASFLFVDKPANQWAKLYTFDLTAREKKSVFSSHCLIMFQSLNWQMGTYWNDISSLFTCLSNHPNSKRSVISSWAD